MRSKTNEWTLRIVAALVVLSLSVGAQGQNWSHKDKKFSGVINAYTPQTTTQNPTTGQTTVTGPYEIRGPWSLKLKKDGTKADFSAELNMEFSDGWVLSVNKGNFDPTISSNRYRHVYAQWKPSPSYRCAVGCGDQYHWGYRGRVFQYHADFPVPGFQPFWNRASPGGST
jgi:hypothetical protein